MTEPMLQIEGLSLWISRKRERLPTLEGLSFAVREGERWAVAGESGADQRSSGNGSCHNFFLSSDEDPSRKQRINSHSSACSEVLLVNLIYIKNQWDFFCSFYLAPAHANCL